MLVQECDRLADLRRALPGFREVAAKGRGKLHGLVVWYRASEWRVRATRTVFLDEEELCPLGEAMDEDEGREGVGGGARRKRGGSRQTKNVGLIVGLERVDGSGGDGVVATTTHLYVLHPHREGDFC